jgi:hypothetical protein
MELGGLEPPTSWVRSNIPRFTGVHRSSPILPIYGMFLLLKRLSGLRAPRYVTPEVTKKRPSPVVDHVNGPSVFARYPTTISHQIEYQSIHAASDVSRDAALATVHEIAELIEQAQAVVA